MRVLISVSDKRGIIEFARGLSNHGHEIISTGGTFNTLLESGIKVTKVADVTNFKEILDGRVKTLHPFIHGGILGDLSNNNHVIQMKEFGIEPIGMVVVNLYPFLEVIKNKIDIDTAVENIDIGGPAMIRSAAKNYKNVSVVVDPTDYSIVLHEITTNGQTSMKTRERLMVKAFNHTALYDSKISEYFFEKTNQDEGVSNFILSQGYGVELRYGENPHQRGFYYGEDILGTEQLWGKELSYNNINDLNGALNLLYEFDEPTCVAIKHSNPCGVASGKDIYEAYLGAYESDPVSIYGGIVAFNGKLDVKTANLINSIFLEIVCSLDFEEEALEILKKKKNIRIMKIKNYGIVPKIEVKSVINGLLVQETDNGLTSGFEIVCGDGIDENTKKDILFGYKIVKHQKSNAISIVKDQKTIGLGTGQVSRIGSAKIALDQAGEKAKGAIMCSDAFIPFSDTIELAKEHGISIIVQPGGSINDEEIIKSAKELGVDMVFVGQRHFKH
jgi:phosphoribosylaminoimidazolecarboxamide formyltransferase/IMP cyclohydrolase